MDNLSSLTDDKLTARREQAIRDRHTAELTIEAVSRERSRRLRESVVALGEKLGAARPPL